MTFFLHLRILLQRILSLRQFCAGTNQIGYRIDWMDSPGANLYCAMSGIGSRKKRPDSAAPLADLRSSSRVLKLKLIPSMQRSLLTLVILAPTPVLPMLFPIGQAEVPSRLSENASFADFSIGQPMNKNDDNDLRQLAHILADAYRNALMHDTPNADLEAADLRLESAAIRLSSRLLYEITKGSCQSEHAAIGTVADRTCVLDNESLGLRGLTDMLSHAAGRLESLGRSAPPADSTSGQRALLRARIKSMEHLYRMVFAISRIYLDRSQSAVYLEAAREHLRWARKHMEIERSLCACSDHEYTARLQELSKIEDRLKEVRDDAARP